MENQNYIQSDQQQDQQQTASEQYSKTFLEKYLCCCKSLMKLFDINSTEFINRLKFSILPFNHKFSDVMEDKPDIYGPFWIYTIVILCISAAGGISRFLAGNGSKSAKFFSYFVPISAGVVYGIGFILPVLLGLIMKLFGSQVKIASIICTYGYSFSVFVPCIILCVIPNKYVQTILLLYAGVSSTLVILFNYWKELGSYEKTKKIIICSIVLICQVVIFFVFNFFFLKTFTKELTGEEEEEKHEENYYYEEEEENSVL